MSSNCIKASRVFARLKRRLFDLFFLKPCQILTLFFLPDLPLQGVPLFFESLMLLECVTETPSFIRKTPDSSRLFPLDALENAVLFDLIAALKMSVWVCG